MHRGRRYQEALFSTRTGIFGAGTNIDTVGRHILPEKANDRERLIKKLQTQRGYLLN